MRRRWLPVATVSVAALAACCAYLLWNPVRTRMGRPADRSNAGPDGGKAPLRPSNRVSDRLAKRPTAQLPTNSPVAAVAGADRHAASYLERMAMLRDLPPVLSPEDAQALRDWLATPYDPGDGLTLREFNGVKNAAADLLLRQPGMPPDFVVDFAAMFADAAYDPVWRDYCLQFLAAGHEKLAARSDPEAVEVRAMAVATLQDATDLRTQTFAGTALLGLQDIDQRDPEAVGGAEVGALASAVASDPQTSEPCRITALRVAALEGAVDVLPAARELVQPGRPELLRQAALATIGDLGAAEDLAMLGTFAQDSDRYVAATAADAKARIERRLAERQ